MSRSYMERNFEILKKRKNKQKANEKVFGRVWIYFR